MKKEKKMKLNFEYLGGHETQEIINFQIMVPNVFVVQKAWNENIQTTRQ